MRITSPSLRKLGLKFLQDFGGLKRVVLDQLSYYDHESDVFNFQDIPRTIKELYVCGHCSSWLKSKTLEGFSSHPQNALFHSNGVSAFNFKSHFLHMETLHLECYSRVHNSSHIVATSLMAYRLLPSSLRTLCLSHFDAIHPGLLCNLPAGLEMRIPRVHSVPQIELLINHASHLRFPHLPILYPLPDFKQLPSVETVHLYSINISKDEFWSILQRFSFPHTASSAVSLAPKLVSLSSHIKLIVDKSPNNVDYEETGPSNGSISWPDTLRSATFWYWGNDFIPSNMTFPQNLTRLNCHTPDESFSCPPGVTRLRLQVGAHNFFGTAVQRLLTSLPSTIISFTLKISSNNDFSQSACGLLPPKLRRLKVISFGPSRNDRFIAPKFFEMVPSTLESIHIDDECHDSVLSTLPLTVNQLVVARLVVTGALIPMAITYTSPAYCFLSRLSDGSYRTLPSAWLQSDFKLTRASAPVSVPGTSPEPLSTLKVVFSPTSLPPTLTSLHIQSFVRPAGRVELPSLITLHTSNCNFVTIWEVLGCPPSLTELICIDHAIKPEILPTILPSKLKIVESNHVNAPSTPHLDRFTSLHTLRICGPIQLLEKLTLPPSVTHLAFRQSSAKRYDTKALKEETLLKFSTLKSLAFSRLSVISDLESLFQSIKECVQGDSFDFTKILGHFIERKHPGWTFVSELPTFHWGKIFIKYPPLTHQTLPKLFLNLPLPLKSVTFGRIKLPSKFGKYLPSTIETLDVIEASGAGAGSPWHLPSTITDLKINSSDFFRKSYLHLPRALKHLTLKSRKFKISYASELPDGLLELDILADWFGLKSLSRLPPSLKKLRLRSESPIFAELILNGVPPMLESFRCSLTISQDQFPMLLAKLPHVLDLDVSFWEFDEWLRSLTFEELKALLDEVKV